MVVYMNVKLSKDREVHPLPKALCLNINGVDYQLSWIEAEVKNWGHNRRYPSYILRGVSFQTRNGEERSAHEVLGNNPECVFKSISWREDCFGDLAAEICGIELVDGDISTYCKFREEISESSDNASEKPEIHKMLTLCTNHISEETADLLAENRIDDIEVYAKRGYGWFITEWNDAALPSDLRACVEYAEKNGCDWLCLDCDGPVMSALPTYEW